MRGSRGFLQIHASKLEGEKSFPRTGVSVLGESDSDLSKALDWADARSAEGRNIYVTLNPMSARDIRGKDLVTGYRAVLADIDVYKAGKTQGEAFQVLYESEVQPTFIINSGRGVQAVYFVDAPDYATWEAISNGVEEKFKALGSDPAVSGDASRIFKLPGYPATSGDGITRATSVMTETGKMATVEAMRAAFPFTAAAKKTVTSNAERTPGGVNIIINEKYDKSKIAEWCEAPSLIPHGYRDPHIASLTGHYAGKKNMSFEEALTTSMVMCRAYVEDFDRDFSGSEVEDKLTRAFNKYRGSDWSATETITPPEIDPDDDSDGLRVKSLGTMLNTARKPEDELLTGLMRKMLGMVYGPDGIGKSVYLLYTIFCQMLSEPFGQLVITDKAPKLRRVLWIETEDGEYETIDRARKIIGGTYPHITENGVETTVSYYGDIRFDGKRDILLENFDVMAEATIFKGPMDLSKDSHQQALKRVIRKGRYDLVVVDTLKQAFPGTDENSNTEMQAKVVTPMKNLAITESVAVILVHHTGHDGTRARGASATQSATRWRVQLFALKEADSDDVEGGTRLRSDRMFRVVLEKNKRGIKPTPTYHRVLADEHIGLTVTTDDGPGVVKVMSASEKLAEEMYQYLLTQTVPLETQKLYSAVGTNEGTGRKAIPELRKKPDVMVHTYGATKAYFIDRARMADLNDNDGKSSDNHTVRWGVFNLPHSNN
jgi:hypothetical protein